MTQPQLTTATTASTTARPQIDPESGSARKTGGRFAVVAVVSHKVPNDENGFPIGDFTGNCCNYCNYCSCVGPFPYWDETHLWAARPRSRLRACGYRRKAGVFSIITIQSTGREDAC
jgi:hypothetical protein